MEYNVNGVDFDGYDPTTDTLLDAKDWTGYPPAGTNFWQQGVLDEAERQVNAASDTAIQWQFSSQSAKDAVDALFTRENIGIDTILVPKT